MAAISKEVKRNAEVYILSHLAAAMLVITLPSCQAQPTLNTGCKDPGLEYMGRITQRDTEAVFYWPGSSVTLKFTGSSIKVRLKDEHGQNYFYSVVDDKQIVKIHPDDSVAKDYFLATNLGSGEHKLQLFKLTEATMGRTWFYGFEIKGHAKILPPTLHARKIEFYGNSITAGYSVDDNNGDSRAPEYFNNYYTYAAITARHYNASYSNISKSGIGLMVSWFPIIMPEMYDRENPADSLSIWNFSKYTPGVVVIDLLQNDSWLIYKHDHPQFTARFGNTPPNEEQIVAAYRKFVGTIRERYPYASIVCTLGSMDATREGSEWPGYVEKAVASLHDPKVFNYFFRYRKSPGHPKRKDQQAMADSLIGFIDSHIKW